MCEAEPFLPQRHIVETDFHALVIIHAQYQGWSRAHTAVGARGGVPRLSTNIMHDSKDASAFIRRLLLERSRAEDLIKQLETKLSRNAFNKL